MAQPPKPGNQETLTESGWGLITVLRAHWICSDGKVFRSALAFSLQPWPLSPVLVTPSQALYRFFPGAACLTLGTTALLAPSFLLQRKPPSLDSASPHLIVYVPSGHFNIRGLLSCVAQQMRPMANCKVPSRASRLYIL